MNLVGKKIFENLENLQLEENCFYAACEKNINFYSKSCHIRSTALIKRKTECSIYNDLTDEKNNLEDADDYQSHIIVEKTVKVACDISLYLKLKKNTEEKLFEKT